MDVQLEQSEKISRLFSGDARYRVAYGGRGSGKTWAFAQQTIIQALTGKKIILCAREFQNSIQDSAFAVIAQQIERLGLMPYFHVGQSYIRSVTGSEYIFKGLARNIHSLKSIEGVDICWVEEAQKTTKASWDVLIPTIRKADSEVWVSFNPDEETDPTYQMFIASTPPDMRIENINWDDNPWFPDVLDKERRYLQSVDVHAYDHVWGGECKKLNDAQILGDKYVIDSFDPQPFWDGPYYGADWGFSQDPTTLVKCWIHENRLYIEAEAYEVGCELGRLPALFYTVPDSIAHKILADNARPETIDYMKRQGFMIDAAPKWAGSVEDGITFLRKFEKIIIHDRCKNTHTEFKLYSYKKDRLTDNISRVIVDAHNHCIDAIRYALSPLIKREPEGSVVFI